jgi:cell division protein FtsA
MKISSLTLYLEINNSKFNFFVLENEENNISKIIYELNTPLIGIQNNRISDLEKSFELIKQNIFFIEQKLNYTFKDIVVILENFNPSFINLAGFKKLNGSQVLRENITYILNTLKSYINEIYSNKEILHIFNSRFNLDSKKIENLPIGLFGDFYSHELSFILINLNDYKNLKNILGKCNLKIKKIILKSFIKGAYLINNNQNTESFFQIQIGNDNSKIVYFENSSLKFEQDFNFGLNIIIKDISKITSLKVNTVKEIMKKTKFEKNFLEDEIVEKHLFIEDNFRKIKKKLIFEIAFARIQEISQIMLEKNINIGHYKKYSNKLFLEISSELQTESLINIFKSCFSEASEIELKILNSFTSGDMLKTANEIVHFGWKKEAIPITQSKKSLIVRFFDTIFG